MALLLSDHTWLWARGYEGGGPYTDLLRRLAHWLMKEPDLEEETLKATSRGQTLTIERRSIKDTVEPVTRDRAVRQGRDHHPRQGRARAVAESHDRRASKASTAWPRASSPASSPSATPTPRELSAVTATDKPLAPILDGDRRRQLLARAERCRGGEPAAPRHAARRPCHAWRGLARAAQARRLSREGRAAVPALHRLPRARPAARPARRSPGSAKAISAHSP